MKKYFIDTNFGSDEMNWLGCLLEGQADVDPEGVLRPGAFEAGGHDPRAGSSHRRPSQVGQA